MPLGMLKELMQGSLLGKFCYIFDAKMTLGSTKGGVKLQFLGRQKIRVIWAGDGYIRRKLQNTIVSME